MERYIITTTTILMNAKRGHLTVIFTLSTQAGSTAFMLSYVPRSHKEQFFKCFCRIKLTFAEMEMVCKQRHSSEQLFKAKRKKGEKIFCIFASLYANI